MRNAMLVGVGGGGDQLDEYYLIYDTITSMMR